MYVQLLPSWLIDPVVPYLSSVPLQAVIKLPVSLVRINAMLECMEIRRLGTRNNICIY